jgi:hypothetical protein
MILTRNIYPALKEHVQQKPYTVLTGARQTGKTSLLRLLYQHLRGTGEQVFFFSLEDPELLSSINLHPGEILKFLPVEIKPILEGNAERRVFLLLDEIQYSRDPSHFLKYLYDTYEWNLKVVATGSSAFYIDTKFRDSLAGRKRIFQLHTLDFFEYLEFAGAPELAAEVALLARNPGYQSVRQGALRQHAYQYLTFGGYPAVVQAPNREERLLILQELKNAYIKRDMDESGVAKPDKFFALFRILADQSGQLLNKQELGSTLGLDAKTVDYYVYILQKCFHIHLLKPYYRNLRKELTKMPKVFFNDLGLRNALLNRFEPVEDRADKGALLENYFFTVLRNHLGTDALKYWRTTSQQEVDFVAETTFEQGLGFEVKWDASRFRASEYRAFTDTYPHLPLRGLGMDDFYTLPAYLNRNA